MRIRLISLLLLNAAVTASAADISLWEIGKPAHFPVVHKRPQPVVEYPFVNNAPQATKPPGNDAFGPHFATSKPAYPPTPSSTPQPAGNNPAGSSATAGTSANPPAPANTPRPVDDNPFGDFKHNLSALPGGEVFDAPEDKSALHHDIADALADLGYFFAKFTINIETDAKSKTASMLIDIIDEGPRAVLGDIEVKGNKINSRDDIVKYLGLRPGEPWNRSKSLGVSHRLWQ